MGFNKGEWSELYTFLHLLINPHLEIVDEHLNLINSSTFQVIEIKLEDKTRYKIQKDKNISKIIASGLEKVYLVDNIKDEKDILLDKILKHKKAKGSFEIKEIQSLIDDFLDGHKLKGNSKVKGDLEAEILDRKRGSSFDLKYNIKSSLGSPATLLNASSHTNFIYEVSNIDDNIMRQNNAIKSRKKLLDRANFLENSGAKISFIKVQSDSFAYNLKMVDSNLDKLLADMLYLSYKMNEKDIKKLIETIIKNKDEYNFYKKKIADFTNAVTFGMRASEKWNGTNEVNGGIIIVTKTGKVYLLDLIYFKTIVDKYLIDNIKLDSPSSTRYKMFEIYKENGRYYFKLNLQVRFK
ncbi:Type II restriction enzyme HpaII [hydrothermal vent metagenome]|uniref:Type II restriction enzyme HpaII n=1 Tax=hydrothermal vent metagenome TaxID=652676 RepID=A0A1W1D1H8_9ZZZZ